MAAYSIMSCVSLVSMAYLCSIYVLCTCMSGNILCMSLKYHFGNYSRTSILPSMLFATDGYFLFTFCCHSTCPAAWSTNRYKASYVKRSVKTCCNSLMPYSLLDAQDAISNFQVASQNSTHITFSWDIVDGYYTNYYIDYFYIYYRERSASSGYRSLIGSFSYSDSNVNGASFQYTTTVTSFSTYGQYLMAVYVYRSRLTPPGTYSDEIYVEVGKSLLVMQMSILKHISVIHPLHINSYTNRIKTYL